MDTKKMWAPVQRVWQDSRKKSIRIIEPSVDRRGIRLRVTSEEDDNTAVVLWDPRWDIFGANTWSFYLVVPRRLSPHVKSLSIRCRPNAPGLLSIGMSTAEFAITAFSSAVIGSVANDVWQNLRRRRLLRRSKALQPLERDYADGMARWFLATQYDQHADIGRWAVDLDTILCVSEKVEDNGNAWEFVYEDLQNGMRYHARILNKADMHAVAATLTRERI